MVPFPIVFLSEPLREPKAESRAGQSLVALSNLDG